MAQTQLNGATQVRAGSITNDRLAGSVADDKLAEDYIYANGNRAFSANQSMGGNRLTSVGDAVADSDVPSWGQVKSAANGKDWKDSVRVATTTNGALSTAFANGQVVDSVTLATGDRILLKDQSTGSENGIYTVNPSGPPTRSVDADSDADVTTGLTVYVEEGGNGGSSWTLSTTGTITLGTTSLAFIQTGGGGETITAGAGLTKTGSTLDIAAANDSIVVGASDIAVQIQDASLETVSGGIRVKHGTAGQVYIANSSGVLTPVTLSGDISAVSSAGVVTLSSNVVKDADFVTRETPSGSVNGSNTAFTLANTPVAGSETVYWNGLACEPGGEDYSITGGSITFVSAPVTGDRIRVSYRK
ncbi:hypothetical protein [Mycobacterium sp. CnD-18-1]|uniref:hypothetical protein n=1 Tax=Mycobacterium sp. CnD-18-1 TaxID=2917744 RepID=UPI001EF2B099|nr:hypothetical protein [Mycobacterium sp. CnD-18-1]MCG7607072.1 hypothetical protein [Mycobacterium sp. CnD-18-1]